MVDPDGAVGESLVLYHHDISVCAQKVRLALAEKGARHELRAVDIMRGEHLAPGYLSLNPKGVVPTLVAGGSPVVESTVILEFIEDAVEGPSLRPAAPHDRARMRWWMQRPDVGLHVACGVLTYAAAFRDQIKSANPPEALADRLARLPDRAAARKQRLLLDEGLDAEPVGEAARLHDDILVAMEAALERGPWLAGETFSDADLSLAPYVLRLDRLGLDRFWEARPRVADWYERMHARPSWAAAITPFQGRGPGDYDDDIRDRCEETWAKVARHLAGRLPGGA